MAGSGSVKGACGMELCGGEGIYLPLTGPGQPLPSRLGPLMGHHRKLLITSLNNAYFIRVKTTYTKINSVYSQIGPPCSQNILSISYVNSVHDHNEQDFTFNLYLPIMKDEDFFKPDTFHVDTILILEPYPYGGSAGVSWNADITLIWDSVTISQGIYSGSGKFIINKEIPSTFPKYNWAVQEIPFKFCNK